MNKRPKSTGASAQTHSFSINAYLVHHKLVAIETLQNLLRNWFASLMTWLVIGIAFALPIILLILLNNLDQFGGEWQGKPRISVYLQTELSSAQVKASMASLSKIEGIKASRMISPDRALEEFQSKSGFDKVLASLPFNPLPAMIEIEPVSAIPADLALMVSKLEDGEGVDSVSFDSEWVERLFAILALGERFVTALAIFLSLGVLLSVGNTIRLAIENRRAEIEIIKLVGGTDSFVRRPFLYLGLWYGLGGALFAWIMVQISLFFLSAPIERLIHSYQNEFQLLGPSWLESLYLLLVGAILGILGASIAVGRHLKGIEPS
ncbi:MAG: cell division transport system permease protein [Candidatus Azotimanducaceae bacterium]